MPYTYAVYSVQDQQRSSATNEKIAAMEEDGWRPHTVSCNFAELCIFWEKAAPADDAPDAGEREDAEDEEAEQDAEVRKGKRKNGPEPAVPQLT